MATEKKGESRGGSLIMRDGQAGVMSQDGRNTSPCMADKYRKSAAAGSRGTQFCDIGSRDTQFGDIGNRDTQFGDIGSRDTQFGDIGSRDTQFGDISMSAVDMHSTGVCDSPLHDDYACCEDGHKGLSD
jgi:hypothetical protein